MSAARSWLLVVKTTKATDRETFAQKVAVQLNNMPLGYLNDLERRKHSSLAKRESVGCALSQNHPKCYVGSGYLVVQRPFFSGSKPCTVYAQPVSWSTAWDSRLPGDIFVRKSWADDSVRYAMDLYDWKGRSLSNSPLEEPNFVYKINPTELENEGWFYEPVTEDVRAMTFGSQHAG